MRRSPPVVSKFCARTHYQSRVVNGSLGIVLSRSVRMSALVHCTCSGMPCCRRGFRLALEEGGVVGMISNVLLPAHSHKTFLFLCIVVSVHNQSMIIIPFAESLRTQLVPCRQASPFRCLPNYACTTLGSDSFLYSHYNRGNSHLIILQVCLENHTFETGAWH